jgi:GT2 family glycosyltransferase
MLNNILLAGDRASWAKFDAEWYLSHYPGLEAEMAASGIADPEHFYWTAGCKRGHSPNPFFDEVWYLQTYRDVAEKVSAGIFDCGFAHYYAIGFADRSPHWLFSDGYYLAGNLDLTRSRLEEGGFWNSYDHYLSCGDAEFRSGHLFFNPELYTRVRPMDAAVGQSPFTRFIRSDCSAGSQVRLSWYFDPDWYLLTYPEVSAEIADGKWSSALQHYLCNPTPRRFDPLEYFSEEYYASVHVDVMPALKKGQFRNAFDHFIQFGVFESRKPHPSVDLGAYFRAIEVQADIQNGFYRDAFAHYIASRGKAGLQHQLIDEADSRALFSGRARSMLPKFARHPIDFTLQREAALTAIVVMYNQFDLTLTALDSLRSNYAGGIDLLLVDSGSTDQSRHVERYVTGARVIRFNHNVGFLAACNAALAHAKTPVTLFMNNDITLDSGAIEAILRRFAATSDAGAVGAKVIRTNGVLQEAGCIIWRDGSTQGYLRDGDPNQPEANFVREVDFCSGVFLAVRTSLLQALGGFDEIFKPAYFEETDLCIRIAEAGYKTFYDPAITITHKEYSSGDAAIASMMMGQNLPKFRQKHKIFLASKYPRHHDLVVHARSPDTESQKILFIEDRLPLRHLGSGFTRSNDIVAAMAALGHQVTVFPIYQPIENIIDIYRDFSDTVEVIHDQELPDLKKFIEHRSGFYDTIWIARTHNAERLNDIVTGSARHLPIKRIILDTEAVAATRNARRDALQSNPVTETLEHAVQRELFTARFCQKIVAVNTLDAEVIRDAGFNNVEVLGHMRDLRPTPLPFENRQHLLFIGALHDHESPNMDGLEWFAAEVLPLLDEALPEDVRFSIAGYVNRRLDLSPLARIRRIHLLGPVDHLEPLYDSHRLFVAPTRYASGIPFKLHEAASYGLPIVASSLLCQQIGWTDDVEILAAGTERPEAFAAQILRAYYDAALWHRLRYAALARLALENGPEGYRQRLGEILYRLDEGYS